MSKTVQNPKKFDGCPVPWCTNRLEHGLGECSSDVHNVHGVNVGTRIGAWITAEGGGDDRPVVYLGLTGPGDEPANHIYLEVEELRALAFACRTLADQLEADLPRVLGLGEQRPYCATTEQVWALYDALPEHLRPAVLLGAFVGLRIAEAAGLRVEDVDFMRGVVTPAVQFPAVPLKTETSKTPVPIPSELALQLSAAVASYGTDWIVTDGMGGQASPWAIERAMRSTRKKVKGLPAEFRFHDLRHYLASLLIADGADVKVVQARLRHASAKTTLDTYSHLWPDADESTRATVAAVLAARTNPGQERAQ